MLKITIPGVEVYDEVKNEFITTKPQVLQMEHSLLSVSKWEAKWQKPFLNTENKTLDEIIDYFRFMTLTPNVPDDVYYVIARSKDLLEQINNYISSPMTATTFSNREGRGRSREIVTSELIYYWMIVNEIPFECQKWHLNRLLTLIHVCSAKNAPSKKIPNKELMQRNKSLNAARRAALGTRG